MTNAYAIGHITIIDEKKWVEYRDKVSATLDPWGGELVFRGKLSEVLAGEHRHTDTVVIRFPSLEALRDWHSSPEYQLLVPLRNEAANVDLLSYES